MARPRVLLIDDDPFFVGILQGALAREGIDARPAGNGEEGVKQAAADPPNAIVLDIAMPKKDGFQALEELKAHPSTRNVPVIMLTNMSSKEDIERCLAHGACDYLIKSQHGPEEIVSRIRRRAANGFSMVELLVVLGVIFAAGLFAYFQFAASAVRERDAERLSAVRSVVSSLAAAAQEKLLLTGCPVNGPLAQCHVCSTGACRPGEDRTAEFLPPDGFAYDGKGWSCSAKAAADCRWSVETDGNEPIAAERYRIRFFLERGVEKLKSGGRVIRADGSLD